MRIIYNQDYLFSGIPNERKKKYYQRVLDFSRAIDAEQGLITQKVINQFKLKKMKGTETIFKFYLSDDGARCLIKYEERDPQIFDHEPGIILLRAVNHDEQGKLGKKLDKSFENYERFITMDLDLEVGEDSDFDSILGKQYMKTVYLPSSVSNDELLDKMMSIDGRVIYRLSDSQFDCLKEEGPIFLLGCAGSGKTLVEVCKALKNAHRSMNQAYFTFTPMLKEVAMEIYNKYGNMNGIIGKTDFYCLKDYMLSTLVLQEDQYFSFERFQQWYKDQKFEQKFKWIKEIGSVNLWTEIRGIIKGFIGNDYLRILEFSKLKQLLTDEEIKFLIEEKIIRNKTAHKDTYIVFDSKRFYEYAKEFNIKMLSFIHSQDINESILDEYAYVDLMNSKYSQFDREERIKIYEFVKNIYQKHLLNSENPLFDDNDLSRMLIKKIDYRELKQLDFVLVDELQDLTEMQIFALTSLAVAPSQVYMSGDVSQIINPTFFRLGRIGVIFRNRFGIDLNKDLVLDENYRNSESIVDISRMLLDIRRKTLGTYSEDIEEVSREIEKRIGMPFFVNTTDDQFLLILSTWIDIPRVAIIVASEETKRRISKHFRIRKETNIYTVQEVKGQEFEKIITYNIISEHRDEWDEIMSGRITKGSELVTRYKYYFNLLYVAITRGKNNLFMFESEKGLPILKEISHLFESLSQNIENVMNLKEYDTEENRLHQAQMHFKSEDYDRARTYYLQLDDKKMGAVCTGHSLIHKGKYLEGVQHLYQFPEYYDKAFQYTNTKELVLFHMILGDKTKKLTTEQISKILGTRTLMQMLTPYENRKEIHNRLLYDAIYLMTKIHTYRFTTNINKIKGEKEYAKN